MKIKYVKNSLEKSPYLKDFKLLSNKAKGKRAKQMNLLVDWISGSKVDSFLEFYLRKTEFGRLFINNMKFSDKFLHSTCPKKVQSKLISLLSIAYNRTELRNFGIKVSSTQYYNSLNHINKDYQQLFGKQKKKTNIYESLVKETLMKHSSESREYATKREPIYYLSLPKSRIYKAMIEGNITTRISLSSFYKLCGKSFKKAAKETDYCPVCKKTEALLKKTNKQNYYEESRQEFYQKYKLYQQHYEVAQHQRKMFAHQKESLEEGSCLVVMDYKQNIRIGGSHIESSRDFYRKSEGPSGILYILQKGRNDTKEECCLSFEEPFSQQLLH